MFINRFKPGHIWFIPFSPFPLTLEGKGSFYINNGFNTLTLPPDLRYGTDVYVIFHIVYPLCTACRIFSIFDKGQFVIDVVMT